MTTRPKPRMNTMSKAPIIKCLYSLALPARSLAHFRFVSFISVSLPTSLNLNTFCITFCSWAAHMNLETPGKNTNGVAVPWDQSKTQKNTEDDGHTPTHPLGPALVARWVKSFHLQYGDWSCIYERSTTRLMCQHDFFSAIRSRDKDGWKGM
jgi:putative salt-induced outer membrane protein YdiY